MTDQPLVKKEISIGTIIAVVGLIVSLTGLGGTLMQIGVWRGVMDAELSSIKIQMAQTQADSRALLKLQTDMDYLKRAVDDLRGR